MKHYFFNICLLALLLSSCGKGNDKEQKDKLTDETTVGQDSKNCDREQEIASLESEMIKFFQETLEKNYGRKDAVDLLVKGMNKYYFNYILEVDKPKLQQINEKLYSKGWLYSYFLDGKELNDSCVLIVPKGMTIDEYRNSPRYQQDLKRKNMDGSVISFAPDSALYMSYAPERARVEYLLLPLKRFETDGFSYYQRELAHASHPAMKKTAEVIDAIGTPSPFVIWGAIDGNQHNICSDFKSDRDIQMFLTLYFWKYLCHSANIDFYTGKNRTAILLEEEAHK